MSMATDGGGHYSDQNETEQFCRHIISQSETDLNMYSNLLHTQPLKVAFCIENL